MAGRFQMQARSSADGQLYGWTATSPDWLGIGFPGPGSALDVSRAATGKAAAVAARAIQLTGVGPLETFGLLSLTLGPPFPSTVVYSDIAAWLDGDASAFFQDLAGTTTPAAALLDPVGCVNESSPLTGKWQAPTLGQRLRRDASGVRSDYFGPANPGQVLIRGAASIPQNNSTLVISFTPRDGVAGPQDGLCLASPYAWGAFYGPASTFSVQAYYNAGSQWFSTAFPPTRTARVTAVIRWTPTGLKAWVMVNGVLTTDTLTATISAGSGPTGASGITLAYGAGGTVGLYGSVSQCLILNRSCTDAEGAALAAWADAKAQPECYPIGQPLIGCVGDSIERAATGVAANQGHCWITIGNLRATYPGLEQCNVAVSGSGIATTPAATYAALTPLYSASRAKNIIHMAIGTNDIATGSSAASVIAGYQSACGALKTQGWKLALATILPRSDPMSVSQSTFNSIRATVNTWITGSAVSLGYADVINDAAGVSGMGADGDSNNTTNYFFSVTGGVHPTAVGMSLLVPARQAALAALLV